MAIIPTGSLGQTATLSEAPRDLRFYTRDADDSCAVTFSGEVTLPGSDSIRDDLVSTLLTRPSDVRCKGTSAGRTTMWR